MSHKVGALVGHEVSAVPCYDWLVQIGVLSLPAVASAHHSPRTSRTRSSKPSRARLIYDIKMQPLRWHLGRVPRSSILNAPIVERKEGYITGFPIELPSVMRILDHERRNSPFNSRFTFLNKRRKNGVWIL